MAKLDFSHRFNMKIQVKPKQTNKQTNKKAVDWKCNFVVEVVPWVLWPLLPVKDGLLWRTMAFTRWRRKQQVVKSWLSTTIACCYRCPNVAASSLIWFIITFPITFPSSLLFSVFCCCCCCCCCWSRHATSPISSFISFWSSFFFFLFHFIHFFFFFLKVSLVGANYHGILAPGYCYQYWTFILWILISCWSFGATIKTWFTGRLFYDRHFVAMNLLSFHFGGEAKCCTNWRCSIQLRVQLWVFVFRLVFIQVFNRFPMVCTDGGRQQSWFTAVFSVFWWLVHGL